MPRKERPSKTGASSMGDGERKPNLYSIVGMPTVYSEWMQLGHSYAVRFVYDGERAFSLSWRPFEPANRAKRRLLLQRYSYARDSFVLALIERRGAVAARFIDYGTGEAGIFV